MSLVLIEVAILVAEAVDMDVVDSNPGAEAADMVEAEVIKLIHPRSLKWLME